MNKQSSASHPSTEKKTTAGFLSKEKFVHEIELAEAMRSMFSHEKKINNAI